MQLHARTWGGDAVVEDRCWRRGEKVEVDGRDEVGVENGDAARMCADSSRCVWLRVPTSFLFSLWLLHSECCLVYW